MLPICSVAGTLKFERSTPFFNIPRKNSVCGGFRCAVLLKLLNIYNKENSGI